MRVVRLCALACASALLLAIASPAAAQSGGFVYALDQVNGAPNQVYGFSVNPATGVLTVSRIPGGDRRTAARARSPSMLTYDRVNSRLYALNAGANAIGRSP